MRSNNTSGSTGLSYGGFAISTGVTDKQIEARRPRRAVEGSSSASRVGRWLSSSPLLSWAQERSRLPETS